MIRDSKSKTNGEDGADGGEGWDGVVRRVVIGVPANCSEKKKEATRRAARTAGFAEVLTLYSRHDHHCEGLHSLSPFPLPIPSHLSIPPYSSMSLVTSPGPVNFIPLALCILISLYFSHPPLLHLSPLAASIDPPHG